MTLAAKIGIRTTRTLYLEYEGGHLDVETIVKIRFTVGWSRCGNLIVLVVISPVFVE